MWHLTLDVDCLLDLIDVSAAGRFKSEMRRLGELADLGVVELAYPATAYREFDRDRDLDRRNRHHEALKTHPAFCCVTPPVGVFRLDVSRLDDASMVLGSDADVQLERSIRSIVRPSLSSPEPSSRLERQFSDIDNLLAHTRAGRDVFVTGNARDFTSARCAKLAELGVVVTTPTEVLEKIESHLDGPDPRS